MLLGTLFHFLQYNFLTETELKQHIFQVKSVEERRESVEGEKGGAEKRGREEGVAESGDGEEGVAESGDWEEEVAETGGAEKRGRDEGVAESEMGGGDGEEGGGDSGDGESGGGDSGDGEEGYGDAGGEGTGESGVSAHLLKYPEISMKNGLMTRIRQLVHPLSYFFSSNYPSEAHPA